MDIKIVAGIILAVLAISGLGWKAQAIVASKANKAEVIAIEKAKADKKEISRIEVLVAGGIQQQRASAYSADIRTRQQWVNYLNNLIRAGQARPEDISERDRLVFEIKQLEEERKNLYK